MVLALFVVVVDVLGVEMDMIVVNIEQNSLLPLRIAVLLSVAAADPYNAIQVVATLMLVEPAYLHGHKII